ncbi:bifunctional GTP diphosphokinase/guanosine-3',5'-bis pyrophosphate 3'-pyrophosphohydrolase [Glaciecola sp. 2405UD65-10]|uniref:bifunctional GTP diphosphokinase/guanosine-3',5'-bis pyrophosphate 3'-pyrophosphohydrolase n=1 Tax=Glaciecola sp. 2405UD65-10 TaxID=3397244 RepID=UPI003B5AA1B4
MYLFEGLQTKISAYLPPQQVDYVRAAYVLARDAHEGQTRSSGDPYITHPVAVASILADMRLDHETLMAALLHDVIEDTDYSKEDLSLAFNETVAELVEGVSKLDKLKFNSKQEAQAENFRKMLMAMVQDIRVILIKLADRTHNMRTLGALRPDKRRRIALETLEIYSPLAHRLGIHDIKNELEDLGFQAMYPFRHRALKSAVAQARGNRKEIIERTQQDVINRLDDNQIKGRVIGREKHLYSIYRKMRSKELSFTEVMDIYGFRIIVESVDHCYRTLGAIHGLYKPIENRFKDYIAIPRSNGYQSLHTSLKGLHGIPLEVQIRTEDMDQLADKGVAAHWLYKENTDRSNTAQMRANQWMQSLVELQQRASTSVEFIESVKSDLFPDEIYVFSPKGKIIELPTGATAVDFAYAVHSDIGNMCVGARVDHRNYSLSTPLENGQSIEIITSPRAKPNANWLNFVVSARARSNIRHYLKRQHTHDAISMGNRLLRHALGTIKLDEIPEDEIQRVLDETKYASYDDLLSNIGMGNEISAMIARRLVGDKPEIVDKKSTVAIKGTEGLMVHFSRCCHPIPDDEIVAILSPGRGVVIHQIGCNNIRKLSKEEPQRVLPMFWDKDAHGDFKASLRVEASTHQGTLAALTSAIAACDSSILNLQTLDRDDGNLSIDIELTTRNRIHFATIMRKLRTLPELHKVSRHSLNKQK